MGYEKLGSDRSTQRVDRQSYSYKAVETNSKILDQRPLSRLGGSSNGRTADSDSANTGSNPVPPAILKHKVNSLFAGFGFHV